MPYSADALPMAISVTSLAKDLTAIAYFPPATAALSIVLLIFETLQVRQCKFLVVLMLDACSGYILVGFVLLTIVGTAQ